MAKDPNASKLNIAFTKHITNALIEAREERLKLEASIPRDRKSTRLNSSHSGESRMPSSA